jgi:hypothetical protein
MRLPSRRSVPMPAMPATDTWGWSTGIGVKDLCRDLGHSTAGPGTPERRSFRSCRERARRDHRLGDLVSLGHPVEGRTLVGVHRVLSPEVVRSDVPASTRSPCPLLHRDDSFPPSTPEPTDTPTPSRSRPTSTRVGTGSRTGISVTVDCFHCSIHAPAGSSLSSSGALRDYRVSGGAVP